MYQHHRHRYTCQPCKLTKQLSTYTPKTHPFPTPTMLLFYGPVGTTDISPLVSLPSQVEIEGLTGDIKFNDDGRRVNYTLHVVEMTVNSAMVCVLCSVLCCLVLFGAVCNGPRGVEPSGKKLKPLRCFALGHIWGLVFTWLFSAGEMAGSSVVLI